MRVLRLGVLLLMCNAIGPIWALLGKSPGGSESEGQARRNS